MAKTKNTALAINSGGGLRNHFGVSGGDCIAMNTSGANRCANTQEGDRVFLVCFLSGDEQSSKGCCQLPALFVSEMRQVMLKKAR